MASAPRTFRIRTAFPAAEPVARFLTMVAMMCNDLLRLVDWMLSLDAAQSEAGAAARIFSFRLQASALFEASKFLREASRRSPQIRAFVASLSEDAQQELEHVQCVGQTSTAPLGEWLRAHRNVTFHYAQLDVNKAAAGVEEIWQALEDAADLSGEIQLGEALISTRFQFADQVAIQWLPDGEQAEAILDALREAVMDLVRFTQKALDAYFNNMSRDPRADFTL